MAGSIFQFGLNGFLCTVQPSDDGKSYDLKAWSEADARLLESDSVEADKLPYPNLPVQDHSQTEALFAPLFEKLEAKKAEFKADEAKEKADVEHKNTKASLEYQKKQRNGLHEEVAKDGTRSVKPQDPGVNPAA